VRLRVATTGIGRTRHDINSHPTPTRPRRQSQILPWHGYGDERSSMDSSANMRRQRSQTEYMSGTGCRSSSPTVRRCRPKSNGCAARCSKHASRRLLQPPPRRRGLPLRQHLRTVRQLRARTRVRTRTTGTAHRYRNTARRRRRARLRPPRWTGTSTSSTASKNTSAASTADTAASFLLTCSAWPVNRAAQP
jgi:hypothetical protein